MIKLKDFILYQIKEMKRELSDALAGLREEDLVSHDPAGHWPVAWIAEHCSDVADKFLFASVKGKLFLDHDPVIVNWPKVAPQPGYRYLSGSEITRRWETLCDAIVEIVDGMSEADLQTTYGQEPYVESCLRVINHTNVHLRSLWCVLGERRIDDKFPEQKTHLPE
jgi:hypothetical protein